MGNTNDLFNQWKAAFEAHDWERENELWQEMGHMPVTPEIRAAAKALHSALFVAPNFDTGAIEAIAKALHSTVVRLP